MCEFELSLVKRFILPIVKSNWPLLAGRFVCLFRFTTLCDWLAKFPPLFRPMGNKPKTNRECACPHAFFRAWRRLHVFASSSDCFVAQFTSIVTSMSDYFGLCFENRSQTRSQITASHSMCTQKSSPKGSSVNAITRD